MIGWMRWAVVVHLLSLAFLVGESLALSTELRAFEQMEPLEYASAFKRIVHARFPFVMPWMFVLSVLTGVPVAVALGPMQPLWWGSALGAVGFAGITIGGIAPNSRPLRAAQLPSADALVGLRIGWRRAHDLRTAWALVGSVLGLLAVTAPR